jgi:NifU-like protein involved in Fe-S cluster formation
MNYNHLTRQHFETAAAAGELSGPGVRRGAAGSRTLGTWVQFDVRVKPGTPPIIDTVRFQAFGCPHVIAVADWLAEAAAGQPVPAGPLEPALALRQRFDVPIEKLGRLLIVEDAWIAAVASPS